MKFAEVFRIAINNLKSNKMRSLLTIMGISLGIASIVFLVSLGYGLQALSIKKIASIQAINTLDVSPGKNSVKKIDNALIEQLKKFPEIEKVSPLLSAGLKVSYKDKKTEAVGNFVNEDFSKLEGIETILGSFFKKESNKIVVSTALLKAINLKSDNALDKEVSGTAILIEAGSKAKKEIPLKLIIGGIIKDDSVSFSYVPISSVLESINNQTVYNSIKAKVTDQSKIPAIKDKITAMGFSVTSIADTIGQVNQIFKIIQIILAFFGLVALLVASIGMFNTMTIALLERTRDIGIMKSLGVRDKDVSRMFLSESSIISMFGGIMGVIIGYLTALLTNSLANYLAHSVGGQSEKLFSMPLLFAGGIIIFSFFVGFITGFYPSRRASKLNPLDALRYE
jgi:putative ABC transport system permease protein